MTYLDVLCISLLLIILVAIILLVYFSTRKIKGGEFSHGDEMMLLPFIDYLMKSRGWQTKMHPRKSKITVSKDSIVAADIFLKREPSGRVGIYHGSNAGTVGWILVVFLILFAWIIGVIVGIVLHILSRRFARDEIVPMLLYSTSRSMFPPQPMPVPPAQNICPNCGRPLRYIPQTQQWFCDTCNVQVKSPPY